jgi:hypothetical protein
MRILSCLLGAAALAAASPASAITWGAPDNNDHPHVVALLFVQNGVGFFSCTGTLLTPYVVVTAGHCTEGGGSVNSLTYVRNTPDLDAAIAAELPGFPNVTAWLNATWVKGQAVPHPNFNDFAEFPDTYDIGVVLLEEGIFIPTGYGQMPMLNQFDFLETSRGSIHDRQARVVGYGLQGKIPAFADDDFVRYQAVSSVTGVNQSQGTSGSQNFKFSNNPGQGAGPGGTCSGDSGGPAFWIDPVTELETRTVMAVNSYGIAPLCNGNDYQFRTDIQTAQDFVNTYIAFHP